MLSKFLTWLSSLNPPSWAEPWLKKAGAYNDVPDRWAQGYHFLGAYGFVFTMGVFFYSFKVALGCTAAIWVFFFFKEFWFDIRYEQNETVATSWEDWRSWALGTLTGLAVFALWAFV
jgi:hypothetical protein